jgi:PadR family transcriptional regulator PadR
MTRRTADLLQGTLDLLILRTLVDDPRHGWGIARRIGEISRDTLSVNQGSLYPALYRLEDDGLIRGDWAESDEGRRIKVYTLTRVGRKRLTDETTSWRTFSGAVEMILKGA